MKSSKMRKVFAALVATCTMMLMTSNAFAATVDIFKDGAFTSTTAIINSVDTAITDGVIVGPGGWTQLNLGDAPVDAQYVHVIASTNGTDVASAQITISDTAQFKMADLGVTVGADYQDIVLDLSDKDLAMLSWCNFQGINDGQWQIKQIFLSDDAASTTDAAEEAPADDAAADDAAAEAPADDAAAMPDTGSNNAFATVALIAMAGSVLGFVALKKFKKAI